MDTDLEQSTRAPIVSNWNDATKFRCAKHGDGVSSMSIKAWKENEDSVTYEACALCFGEWLQRRFPVESYLEKAK
jgi:hypothetical protein